MIFQQVKMLDQPMCHGGLWTVISQKFEPSQRNIERCKGTPVLETSYHSFEFVSKKSNISDEFKRELVKICLFDVKYCKIVCDCIVILKHNMVLAVKLLYMWNSCPLSFMFKDSSKEVDQFLHVSQCFLNHLENISPYFPVYIYIYIFTLGSILLYPQLYKNPILRYLSSTRTTTDQKFEINQEKDCNLQILPIRIICRYVLTCNRKLK